MIPLNMLQRAASVSTARNAAASRPASTARAVFCLSRRTEEADGGAAHGAPATGALRVLAATIAQRADATRVGPGLSQNGYG